MEKYVNDNPLQFALRKTQDLILSTLFMIWICVAVVILTFAGPFGTYEHFNVLERFAYWGLTAPATFIIANFSATLISTYLMRIGVSYWPRYVIAGTIAGIPVGLFVWSFGILIGHIRPYNFVPLPQITIITISVTLPVALLFAFYGRNQASQNVENSYSAKDKDVAPDTGIENFFARLPKSIGRDLIYLNAQDHYVKAVTSKGSEMILFRLSDADGELSNFEGFRVHRSWWVAQKHIIDVRMDKGRRTLVLSNGDTAPVGRVYWKQIKPILMK